MSFAKSRSLKWADIVHYTWSFPRTIVNNRDERIYLCFTPAPRFIGYPSLTLWITEHVVYFLSFKYRPEMVTDSVFDESVDFWFILLFCFEFRLLLDNCFKVWIRIDFLYRFWLSLECTFKSILLLTVQIRTLVEILSNSILDSASNSFLIVILIEFLFYIPIRFLLKIRL